MLDRENNIAKNDKLTNIISQIDRLNRNFDYNTHDFTIDFLVTQFNKGNYSIKRDDYCQYIWDQHRKSSFIESILLCYPIPIMFLSNNNAGHYDIVDGTQRISTLAQFLGNDLVLSNLKKLTELNSYTFDQLPLSIQRKFRKKFLRTIVLDKETSLDVRAEIFNRINSSRFSLT
jgi:uncharacterized protein with ParB-like and HNH nuclease domain